MPVAVPAVSSVIATVGAIVSTVEFVVSVALAEFPTSSVAVSETFKFDPCVDPVAAKLYAQIPDPGDVSVRACVALPPNAVKSAVTPPISAARFPSAPASQRTKTVSPSINAGGKPLPLPPVTVMKASVIVGGVTSVVKLPVVGPVPSSPEITKLLEPIIPAVIRSIGVKAKLNSPAAFDVTLNNVPLMLISNVVLANAPVPEMVNPAESSPALNMLSPLIGSKVIAMIAS